MTQLRRRRITPRLRGVLPLSPKVTSPSQRGTTPHLRCVVPLFLPEKCWLVEYLYIQCSPCWSCHCRDRTLHADGVELLPQGRWQPKADGGRYATPSVCRATFPMGKVRDGGRFIHLCLTSLVCRGVMSLQGHFFMFRQGSTPEIYRKFEQKFVQNSSRIAHLQ